jgi:hypothetical protein
MRSIRKLTAAVLVAVSAIAQAESPYQILGLHTDLIFTEAVALAEKLGGNCQTTTSETQDGGLLAECGYATCGALNPASECEQLEKKAPALTFGGQPITRIVVEAPGDSARLTRVFLEYAGSNDVIAEYLTQAFGPPHDNGPPANQKSWSHSRRLNWTQGHYRMGLMDSPKLIVLAAETVQK